ncbi:cyclin-dependent kinase inhibitor 7-like [Diospyros lotus]|uniref:cyclin-dependent kinase inhibitor 7-like n=1 Tax=Diospyros lotus TaxID=55363 RepID=UPI00225B7CE1|nr:cyclin-dependent kinase inhibitor 7-like [Diospyros lotus]
MEIAHVGVRTRAQALAIEARANSGPVKKRKLGAAELKFSSSLVQLRSRRRVAIKKENPVSTATSSNSGRQTASKVRSSSPSSDQVQASCCSSNGSSDLAKEVLEIVDLEDDSRLQKESSTCDFDNGDRRESTPSSELQGESGELESTTRPLEANSRRRSSAEKMPSATELEEFFAAAEEDLHEQFKKKYNYDIVKDVPLQGRYEWIMLKP